MGGMHARLLQEHSELHVKHAQELEEKERSNVERFNCLEKELLASVGKQAWLLQEHSEPHGKHAQDLEERKYQKELEDSVEKQARSIVEERFNCLDKELEASVGKHARLLQEHSEPHGEQDQGLSESHDYRERAEKRRQRLENLLLRYAGAEQE